MIMVLRVFKLDVGILIRAGVQEYDFAPFFISRTVTVLTFLEEYIVHKVLQCCVHLVT